MRDEHDCVDRDEEPTCRYCNGRGYLTVDSGGAGPAYHCTDCDTEEDDDE